MARRDRSACGPRGWRGRSHGTRTVADPPPPLRGRRRIISSMRNRPLLIALVLATPSLACSSSEPPAEKPSDSFSSSACKKEKSPTSLASHIRTLRVISNESGLAGLRCVAWQRVSANELRLDLYNFNSACGATWTGNGTVAADGTLNLHIDNPSCNIARCGSCMYDWSFDLNVTIAAGGPVPVAISVNACAATQAPTTWSAVIGAEQSGIRCTLADYGSLTWQASATNTCGTAGMPCVGSLLCGSGQATSTGTCGAGLVCDSSAAENQPVCLVPCTVQDDCPRPDVWSCQSGLCRPIP